MHFSILALFALLPSLALNTLASPTPTDGCNGSEYCARALEPQSPTSNNAAPTPTYASLTNAQRLARGLPIKPPHRRVTIGLRSAFPRSSSLPRITFRGIIKVTDVDNGQALGYISRNSFNGAQYRYQPLTSDALIVSFSIDAGVTTASGVQITTENSDISGFPYLSLVQGRDDTNANLGPGSFHYTYIAGMAEPGSPSDVPVTSPSNSYTAVSGLVRAASSKVWEFDTNTMGLRPRWVNSDGSIPNLFSFSQGSALYTGGDEAAFFAKYPAPGKTIRYEFVPL